MSYADLKNVKITKIVLSLTKFNHNLPAICCGYLCDFIKLLSLLLLHEHL